MSEAGVTSGAGRGEVPFRPRGTYAGHEMFGGGGGVVLIDPDVAVGLRRAAELLAPHETGGLLYGRFWRDSVGRYTVVDGFVQAGPDAGKTGEFNLSPMGTQLLRETAAKSFPAADEVGWWHTHHVPSPYSQTDFAMQRAFKQPGSVGLLVYATGTPWATAYLGPDGRPLGAPGALPPASRVPGLTAMASAGAGLPPRWNFFRRPRWAAPRAQVPRAQVPRAQVPGTGPGQPKANPLRGYRLRGASSATSPPAGSAPADSAPAGSAPAGSAPAGTPGAAAATTPTASAPGGPTAPGGPAPGGPAPGGPAPGKSASSGPAPDGPPPGGPAPGGPAPAAPFSVLPPDPARPTRSPDTLWQPQRLERPHDAVHHSTGARAVLALAACVGIGAVVAIIVLAVTIVSAVTRAAGKAITSPSLTWSCHHNGVAPGTYACVATTALPPGSTVWWLADGKRYGKGLLMTITVHRKERIEPVLVTPSGQQFSKGSTTLKP